MDTINEHSNEKRKKENHMNNDNKTSNYFHKKKKKKKKLQIIHMRVCYRLRILKILTCGIKCIYFFKIYFLLL